MASKIEIIIEAIANTKEAERDISALVDDIEEIGKSSPKYVERVTKEFDKLGKSVERVRFERIGDKLPGTIGGSLDLEETKRQLSSQWDEYIKGSSTARKNTEAVAEEIKDVANISQNAKGAFAGAFLGSVAYQAAQRGLEFLKDTFKEVVELAEEKPELFTTEQLRNVKDYSAALGELKSAFTEMKIEIVSGIAPALTEVFRGIANTNDIRARANELVAMGASREQALAQASREVNDATRDQAAALQESEFSMKEYEKAINDAINTQNQFYSSQISNVEKLAGMREKNIQTEEQFASRRQKIQDELTQTQIRLGQLYNEQDRTLRTQGQRNRQYRDFGEELNNVRLRIIELNGSLADLDIAEQDAAAASKKAMNQMIFDMLQAKLAADGLTSSAEYLYELQVGKQLGLFTEADVKTMQDVNTQVNQFASAAPQALTPLEQSFKTVNQPMTETRNLMKDIASYDGKLVNFGVNFYTQGGVPNMATPNPAPLLPGFGRTQRREIGGPVMANQVYLVGERGPEMFVPNQSGNIISNDRMSSPVINVYATVRNDNDIDFIAQEVERRIVRK